MKHLRPLNAKARRIDAALPAPDASEEDVVALQQGQRPHVPLG